MTGIRAKLRSDLGGAWRRGGQGAASGSCRGTEVIQRMRIAGMICAGGESRVGRVPEGSGATEVAAICRRGAAQFGGQAGVGAAVHDAARYPRRGRARALRLSSKLPPLPLFI